MTTIARIVTGAAVVASLSTPAFAQKVTYDYHRGQDFNELRTFSFREAPPADTDTSHTAYDSPIVRQNTNAAIAAQLEARGLVRDDQHPDMLVTTERNFDTRQYIYSSPSWGYGYGWGYYGNYGYGPTYSYEETMGTLTIDVINARTGQLVWRGIGEKDVHEMSKPEKRLKRINREVGKIFKNYPATTIATSGRAIPTTTGD